MLLIGSRALAYRARHLLYKDPVDFDFISTKEEAEEFLEKRNISNQRYDVEGHIIVEGTVPLEFSLVEYSDSSKMLVELVSNDPKKITTTFGDIPSLNLLFALKSSHKYLKNSPFFWKTARDYHAMKHEGCVIQPEHMEFFRLREKETYSYKHPNLNVKKNEFFDGDQIKYVYDHDTIHESMKLFDQPAYTYYQKDGSEVLCDKNKFFALPEKIRLAGVLEESYVLALERSQIPHPNIMTPKQSFLMALSKVCSSITSGWFREYAYENIFKAVQKYDDTYVSRFHEHVKSGLVKLINT